MKCNVCQGTGHSVVYRTMSKYIRPIFTDKLVETSDDYAKMTESLSGISSKKEFGYDAGDVDSFIFEIAEKSGLRDDWYLCKICKGSGAVR